MDAWRKVSSHRGRRYDDVPKVRTLAFVKFQMDWLRQFQSRNGIYYFSCTNISDDGFVKVDFLQDYTIVDRTESRRILESTTIYV